MCCLYIGNKCITNHYQSYLKINSTYLLNKTPPIIKIKKNNESECEREYCVDVLKNKNKK